MDGLEVLKHVRKMQPYCAVLVMTAHATATSAVEALRQGAIDYLEDKYLKGPNASAKYFNASRPAALEEEAVFRAICLAEVTGCPLYIPHVTAGRVLRPIRRWHGSR